MARRLMATTGYDGYTAVAVVRDVAERQGDSPHAGLVGLVAGQVADELAQPFADFFERMRPGFEALTAVLTGSLNMIIEQYQPVVEALGRTVHDYDKTAHPIRHRLRCPACRPLLRKR